MKYCKLLIGIVLALPFTCRVVIANDIIDQKYPIAKPGLQLIYKLNANELPGSVVRKFELIVGDIEEKEGVKYQWINLISEKGNGQLFSVWMLSSEYPSASRKSAEENMLRYIISKADSKPVEYSNLKLANPVLPNTGAWEYLLPRSASGKSLLESIEDNVKYLGHDYQLISQSQNNIPVAPKEVLNIRLTPDLLIGVPHNAKVKDETRRYDESDYEYVELTKGNYTEMIENGINVFRVNAEQVKWIENENVYYWGIGGADVNYPECLYQSNYIGPAIFFDEPMVGTRDYVIKPMLQENPELRKTITPNLVFEEFKKVFHKKKYEEGPTILLRGLSNRKDVDIGDMDFLQQNMYSWETMPASAIYQLSEGDVSTPSAMVFEPPGRFGAKRVLPELNMSFDCQIPINNPNNLFGIIKGFIRGAARATGKDWGISIYGQVDKDDAYWMLTHAYDHGATRFFYWDSHQLAAVPYNEYFAMSKHLRNHANSFPQRNLDKLKRSAEVAILIPPGYNLGHVKMGIGNISGLPELNMERTNSHGIKYGEVMNNFYIEIERCIRLGVEYDIYWNLENINLKGYHEIIDIREDGKVEVLNFGLSELLNSARKPERPSGESPQLTVEVMQNSGITPYSFTAKAKVVERSAPVYYTQGADKQGIFNNTYVLWELYGPEEEDYTDFWQDRWEVKVSEYNNYATIEINFTIDQPGSYRLRIATADVAGRSTVVWKDINIQE